jgi:uncharacterized membrane protein YphA (DoxX/SURF4 family)
LESFNVVMSHPIHTLRLMEPVPNADNSHSPVATTHHWIRWSMLTIIAVLVIANWRVVAALIAVVAAVSLVIGLLVVIGLMRKVTRPIGQLSLIDAAIITWLYRRWDERRASQHTNDSSNITNIRPR